MSGRAPLAPLKGGRGGEGESKKVTNNREERRNTFEWESPTDPPERGGWGGEGESKRMAEVETKGGKIPESGETDGTRLKHKFECESPTDPPEGRGVGGEGENGEMNKIEKKGGKIPKAEETKVKELENWGRGGSRGKR